MTILFDAVLHTVRICGVTRFGNTGVITTTTLTDTTGRWENDDYFNGGMLLLPSTSQFMTITDYVKSTKVATFIAPTPAITPGSGIPYYMTRINKDEIIQAINTALSFMGAFTTIDESLVVVEHQTEYALPAGVSSLKAIDVYVDNSDSYGFTPVTQWREYDGTLYLPYEIPRDAGLKIRLYYDKNHDAVTDADDTISDAYNLERLAWTASYMYMLQNFNQLGNVDEKQDMLLQIYSEKTLKLAREYPVVKRARDPILAKFF